MDIFNKTIDWDISTPSGTLSQKGRAYLKTAGGWAIFLSIIGFLLAGFVATTGSFISTMIGEMLGGNNAAGFLGGGVMAILYLLAAATYFIPSLFLLGFGNNARKAAEGEDAGLLEKALDNLRKFLLSLGILTIISIAVGIALFLAMVAGLATAAGMNG